MRTLKLALAATAAFAFNASAQVITGMGDPPGGIYQLRVAGDAARTPDAAFHAGGVAACDGCHVMHNATSGQAKSTRTGSTAAPWSGVTNMYLLQGSDQSSTCLICHAGAGQQFQVFDTAAAAAIATSPRNMTPGGDFSWLAKDWRNSVGRTHGHNVAAADFSLSSESGRTAPGGTWVNGSGRRQLACSSCHDPHGRYRVQADGTGERFVGPGANGQLAAGALPIGATGSYGQVPQAGQYAVGTYRLLAGQFYAPASNPTSPFANDPPSAVAPVTYNRSEGASDTRVAYGAGMSEWCQNCHGSIHMDSYSSGVAGLKHPAGNDAKFHVTQIQIYNSYIASGVVGAPTNPYTSLVPFETGNTDRAALYGFASGSAPLSASATSNVMCLSCHRAHASAFDSMVRWDQNATFLTDGTTYTAGLTSNTAYGSGAERGAAITQAAYYDRAVANTGAAGTIGTYQRSLCNKCHGKD